MTPETPASPTRRAALIYHPGRIDADVLRPIVEAAEEEHGWAPTTWYETKPDKLGDVLAVEAVEDGVDLVITAGGDGTVRGAAEALAGGDVPLAILPHGTGNLLARNLGVDVVNQTSAVQTAFGGLVRRIDLGTARVERADGTRETFVFTVLGGIGIDAGMIANTSSELKAKVGWVAYLDGIAKSIRGGASFHVRTKFDGGTTHSSRAQSVMVGNCGSMPGGLLLLPDAKIDDGLLDTAVMRPRGLVGWLQIWWAMVIQSGVLRKTEAGRKLASDNAKRVRALSYVQSKEVMFRVTSGPEEFEIDGEAMGEVVAGRITVDAGVLSVLTPDPDAPSVTAVARAARQLGQEVEGRVGRVLSQAQEFAATASGVAAGAAAGAKAAAADAAEARIADAAESADTESSDAESSDAESADAKPTDSKPTDAETTDERP